MSNSVFRVQKQCAMCFTLCIALYVTDSEGLGGLKTASSCLTKILIVQSSSLLTQTECASVVPHFWLLNAQLHLNLTKHCGKCDTPRESHLEI